MSNIPTTVVTGKNTRLSYLNANEPKAPMDGRGEPKYSTAVLIPKDDAVTVNKINAAIRAAYQEGEGKLRGNGKSVPRLEDIRTPLRDGDRERPDDEVYQGHWFLNASSTRKPKAFDRDGNEIIDPSELYSGIYAKVMLNFYAYNSSGNRGIAAGFQGLKKMRDGRPLGGASVTAEAFGDEEEEESEDDFLK